MIWKRLLAFFIPSPGALTLLWAALGVISLLSMTALVIALDDSLSLQSALAFINVLALPAGMLLLTIAVFVERKPGARLALWLLVCFLLGIILLWFFSLTQAQSAEAAPLAAFCCLCLPVYLLPLLVLFFLGRKAYPAFRQILRLARARRLVEMIQARGEVGLAQLSAELAAQPDQVLPLLRELIAGGDLMAYFDEHNRMIYSVAALAEKQRRLLAMVTARGKIALAELAAELKVSPELVRQWASWLALRRQLHGFADWNGGYLYAREVDALLARGECPHCGGTLEVAGKGLIQCQHCGVEVFQ